LESSFHSARSCGNQGGQTIVGYNDPRHLTDIYGLTPQATTLEAMASLLQKLATDATGNTEHH
jgi:hypothetical protein